MTREIPLTRGLVALIDDADYEEVSQYRWYAQSGRWPYPRRKEYANGGETTILMHRQLLGLCGESRYVYADHRNGDVLDNRRANLRACDNALNQANSGTKKRANRSSLYKGVSRKGDKWYAKITASKNTTFLGSFATEDEAARAYDAAALDAWGDFAYLNFPPTPGGGFAFDWRS